MDEQPNFLSANNQTPKTNEPPFVQKTLGQSAAPLAPQVISVPPRSGGLGGCGHGWTGRGGAGQAIGSDLPTGSSRALFRNLKSWLILQVFKRRRQGSYMVFSKTVLFG